jgi:signal transduction histidine kinase
MAFRSGQLAEVRLRAIELELARATLALEDLSAAWDGRPCRLGAEQVDVPQLLAESVEAWRGAATSRGVELRLEESEARPTVLGERLRLAQALGNLIANAVEHGGGRTEVSWRSDPTTVKIEVLDQGPGLPAPVADLARRPTVGWPRRARRRVASRRGHGLAIASAIATAHGGRLSAAPSERGARLVLELPSVPAGAVSSLDSG